MRTTDKPFSIDKKRVYEAYKAVKSNAGAAGVDGQTIEQFEADLQNNLYKLWNRMSSGSYFPPPVRAVSIPKKSGGQRILGVPTVADRVAQMVVKQLIEPDLDPLFLADSSANTRCSACRFEPRSLHVQLRRAPGTGLQSSETSSQNRRYRDLSQRQRSHVRI